MLNVLLTNDDGGPNDVASPYIKYIVEAIEKHTDWNLTICVPSCQKSWIGKAHFAGRDVTTKYIYSKIENPTDNSYHGPFGYPQEKLQNDKTLKEWVLVDDGTPATCADIGINHVCGPDNVDLVLSGPNVGRNSSTLYSLSSGTIGGAMEGCSYGKKAIAVSYAYEKKYDTDPQILREASLIAIKIVQRLIVDWSPDADLYTINIPLVDDLKFGTTKVWKVPVFKNNWEKSLFLKSGSSVDELRHSDIVDSSVSAGQLYKWSPDFYEVHKAVAESKAPSDGKVISQGMIAVTGLQAAFKEAAGFNTGEEMTFTETATAKAADNVSVTYKEGSYILDPLKKAIDHQLTPKYVSEGSPLFQYGEYEDIDHERLLTDKKYMANTYTYRKGLIRKNYLSHTIEYYVAKHPESILKKAFPESYQFELAYADFLDDTLDEVWELRCELEENERNGRPKTYILKPSMSDKGQGIRLFQNIPQLQAIFDAFEENEDGSDEDDEDDVPNGVITSQLRNFVVQDYVSSPLLLPEYGNRKFHIRTYVLCKGNLTVYVYQRMLMLFSESRYTEPNPSSGPIEMTGHLTNTCLQEETEETVVVEFANSSLTSDQQTKILDQINEITSELFNAATSVDRINFQPLENAFETYGLDFLVDDSLNVSLLEVNAYPDFKQTGGELKDLIYELFDGTIAQAVRPFFNKEPAAAPNLKKVLSQENTFN